MLNQRFKYHKILSFHSIYDKVHQNHFLKHHNKEGMNKKTLYKLISKIKGTAVIILMNASNNSLTCTFY